MAKEDLVIRSVWDWYTNEVEISLQDQSGDNQYEVVTGAMLHSLDKRNLFNYSSWKPSLQITIHTYSLKDEVKSKL